MGLEPVLLHYGNYFKAVAFKYFSNLQGFPPQTDAEGQPQPFKAGMAGKFHDFPNPGPDPVTGDSTLAERQANLPDDSDSL